MEDQRGSYGAPMHGSTLTTSNVLITLWSLIWESNFLLYFHLCPKTSIDFSNLHEFQEYSLEHVQYLECACIFFKKLNVES